MFAYRFSLWIQRVIGGEEGIRTPGTLPGSTVFKTAALNHSATSPLRTFRNPLQAAHERAERIGDYHRAVRLLEVLEDRNQRTTDGQARTVERVHELRLTRAL